MNRNSFPASAGNLLLTFARAALLLPLLISCEEVMDVSFPGSDSHDLVVEGLLTTDTTAHRVVLSYTGNFFERSEQEMATGAEVAISDGVTSFQLTETIPGVYLTDSTVFGLTGKTYTLHVKLADGSEYAASDELRPCGALDSISQSDNYNNRFTGYGYDVKVYAFEPPPVGDNYLYSLYLGETLYTDTITETSFFNDEFVDGNYIVDFPVYRIRENDLVSESFVTLEVHSVSTAYYEFLNAVMLETVWRGSPWDGPPANVPGNVSNGGRGFFRTSDVKRTSRLFTPKPRAN